MKYLDNQEKDRIKVLYDYGTIASVYAMYLAPDLIDGEDGLGGYQAILDDVRTRRDVSKKNRENLQLWFADGKVYYPVYSCSTSGKYTSSYTTKHSSDVYSGSSRVVSVDYSVRHTETRGGISKKSDGFVSRKKHNGLLPGTILNKEGIVEINAYQNNMYIYSPGLFMNENEQHEFGLETSRKGVSRKTSFHTKYRIYCTLVPIYRGIRNYKGKEMIYEVNLNNGCVFSKHIPQKVSAKVIKFILAVINLSTRLSMLIYPFYNLVYLFLDKSYFKAGTNLFFQILYGALNVSGLVISAGYLIGSIGNTRYCYDGIVRANQESKRAWKAYLGSFPVPIFFLILYALINLWMVK